MIEELMLEGFQAFKHAKIRFTKGLNLITGRNNAGKTSILEGIIYGLYGKLPDAADSLLVSRLTHKTPMTVRLRFRSLDGGLCETALTGKLTSNGKFRSEEARMLINGKPITVSGKEELRREVSKRVGMGYRRFINTVYVRQGRLTEILEPRREDMDAVLGINLLRELLKQLEEARSALSRWEGWDVETLIERLEKKEIPNMEENLKLLKDKVERVRGEVEDLQERIRKAESPELETLLRLINERDKLRGEMKDREAAVKALMEGAGARNLEQLKEIVKQLTEGVKEQSELIDKLKRRREEVYERKVELQTKVNELRRQVKRHKELLRRGVQTCPTCGQRINADLVRRLSEEKLRQANIFKEEAEPLGKEIKELDEAIKQVECSLTNLRLRLKNAERAVREVKDHRKKVEELSEQIGRLKLGIKGALDKLQLELDPEDPNLYGRVEGTLVMKPRELKRAKHKLEQKRRELENSERRLRRTEKELKELREKLEKLRVRKRAADLASTLTGRVKDAMEEVRSLYLRSISIRARRLFDNFTDQRVYAAFHIDPDNYKVYVHQRGLYERIPATRVGGGHQTLIAISLRLAIAEATGGSRILILDEPTYGVDSQNLPQFMENLAKAAEKMDQMILVTHHGLGEEYASNIIHVSIGEDGASKITQP